MTRAPAAYENKNPFEQCVTQKNNNKNIYRSRLRALKNSLFFLSSRRRVVIIVLSTRNLLQMKTMRNPGADRFLSCFSD